MPSFGSKFLACLLLSSAILVSGQFEHYLDSLQPSELYEFEEGSLGSIHYLPKGDNKTFELQLEQPIHFYGEQYDQLYVSNIPPLNTILVQGSGSATKYLEDCALNEFSHRGDKLASISPNQYANRKRFNSF